MSDGAFYDGDVAAGGKWKTVRMSRPPDVPLADEYERYSNWWSNADTVKTHIRYFIGEKGGLIARNIFKRAPDVDSVATCFLKRFGFR